MNIWEVLQDIADAAQDVIDAYFIQTDLKDVNLSDAERSQSAHYDSMASHMVNEYTGDDTPIGKTVL